MAPLTGLAVTPELARRPAVAVALVRADGGSVVGVTAADLVYEEFDAPGRSRLIAIFQSRDATVGPVADTAPLDAPLLGAAKPVFAYAGGPGSFVRQLSDRVIDASALRQPSFFSGTRPAQRVSTARLRTLAPATAAAPPPVFSHRPVGEAPVDTAANAERAVVKVPGAATRTWTWQAKTSNWRRDDGIVAANVLVFTVPYKDVPRGKEGGEVATATPVGEGKALVLTGLSRGRSIAATWYRRSRTGTFNVLDDKAKKAVRLTPGSTWVVLAPSGSTVSTS